MNFEVYPVYKVKYKLDVVDPHMPLKRQHTAIFVQTRSSSGQLHHVTGDVTTSRGMIYQTKEARDPRESSKFYSREFLGYTRANTHPQVWDTVLRSLPTPPQQKAPNPAWGGHTEPFKYKTGSSHIVFYKPGEKQKPLWKCTEWVDWYAILALQQNNLIQRGDQLPSSIKEKTCQVL